LPLKKRKKSWSAGEEEKAGWEVKGYKSVGEAEKKRISKLGKCKGLCLNGGTRLSGVAGGRSRNLLEVKRGANRNRERGQARTLGCLSKRWKAARKGM